jgi:uncharacterized membrane protein YkvA (DUF1232 family)
MGGLTDDSSGLVLILIVVALVIMAVVAAVLFFRLLTKFKLVNSALAPFGAKAAFWGALIYTVFPIDVLPDPFMGDDIGFLALALFYINRVLASLEDNDDDDRGVGPEIIG